MPKTEALGERVRQLEAEYRSRLVGALRECAAGRWGLFGHNEHLSLHATTPKIVHDLRELGKAIDAMRSRIGLEPFPLHELFRTSRGPATENAVGEPKQAQAWLRKMGED